MSANTFLILLSILSILRLAPAYWQTPMNVPDFKRPSPTDQVSFDKRHEMSLMNWVDSKGREFQSVMGTDPAPASSFEWLLQARLYHLIPSSYAVEKHSMPKLWKRRYDFVVITEYHLISGFRKVMGIDLCKRNRDLIVYVDPSADPVRSRIAGLPGAKVLGPRLFHFPRLGCEEYEVYKFSRFIAFGENLSSLYYVPKKYPDRIVRIPKSF